MNLALLPDSERRDIELQRQAALLIYKVRKKKISRIDVNNEIIKLPEHEQQKFRDYLNKFNAMHKGKNNAK